MPIRAQSGAQNTAELMLSEPLRSQSNRETLARMEIPKQMTSKQDTSAHTLQLLIAKNERLLFSQN